MFQEPDDEFSNEEILALLSLVVQPGEVQLSSISILLEVSADPNKHAFLLGQNFIPTLIALLTNPQTELFIKYSAASIIGNLAALSVHPQITAVANSPVIMGVLHALKNQLEQEQPHIEGMIAIPQYVEDMQTVITHLSAHIEHQDSQGFENTEKSLVTNANTPRPNNAARYLIAPQLYNTRTPAQENSATFVRSVGPTYGITKFVS